MRQHVSAIKACVTVGEDGQGLAEYALILVFIALVSIVALVFLGGQLSQTLSYVGSSV